MFTEEHKLSNFISFSNPPNIIHLIFRLNRMSVSINDQVITFKFGSANSSHRVFSFAWQYNETSVIGAVQQGSML